MIPLAVAALSMDIQISMIAVVTGADEEEETAIAVEEAVPHRLLQAN